MLRMIELADKLSGSDTDTLGRQAAVYSSTARMAQFEGRRDDAVRLFRTAVDVQAKVVALGPESTFARRNLAVAWSGLAVAALQPESPHLTFRAHGPLVPVQPERRKEALEAQRRAFEQIEWIHQRDPGNQRVQLEYAIAMGRRAMLRPAGDPEAIPELERSLALLARRDLALEFHGALAERHRQIGQFRQAAEAWRSAEASFHRWRASEPDSFDPHAYMIPIYFNWALELARRKDAPGALALVRKGQQLAAEASARDKTSADAAGWSARTMDWTAEVHEILRNKSAAQSARTEASRVWRQLAARTDLPPVVIREAKSAVAVSR